ncbi:ceramidase domain-containing protein [Methylocapsa acidiphila]|uniref:ceramidase domain-containing protein n=1 Tax=Methylocapsa acidiphila TaxID=133552 RepID=UPI000424468F|nr:ceramidase domain-containing protein [Methylocapsa acidiphila]
MEQTHRKVWIVVAAGLPALALIFLLLGLLHIHPWAHVAADRVTSYHKEQCELVNTSGFFLQFHNFWSNAAYLAVGLLIFTLNKAWTGWTVGAALIILAICSGWFHGTLSEFGQTVDIMGVYAVLLALVAYGFIEMVPLEYDDPWAFVIMFSAIAIGLVGGIVRAKVHFFDSDYFTPFLVFILIVYMISGALRYVRDPKTRAAPGDGLLAPLALAVLPALAAVVFKFSDGDDNAFLARHGGDYAKCFYGPSSLVQGHALWHVFSALMFLGVFEFFRSLLARSNSVLPWRPARPDAASRS